jgi:hypothetical protein
MQKLLLGQDVAPSPSRRIVSAFSGVGSGRDQADPFQLTTFPPVSMAKQSVEDRQPANQREPAPLPSTRFHGLHLSDAAGPEAGDAGETLDTTGFGTVAATATARPSGASAVTTAHSALNTNIPRRPTKASRVLRFTPSVTRESRKGSTFRS